MKLLESETAERSCANYQEGYKRRGEARPTSTFARVDENIFSSVELYMAWKGYDSCEVLVKAYGFRKKFFIFPQLWKRSAAAYLRAFP